MGIIAGLIGGIAALAAPVVKALAVVGLAVDGLKKVGGVLVNLAKSLGLIKPQVQVDQLGDKAIQCGYDPERYDTYTDYVKAVEDFDSLDPEKSKQISEEDKIKKGMELATGVMIEKYQDFPMDKFCTELGKNPDLFTEGVVSGVGKLITEDTQNISDILGYLDGSLKDDSKIEGIVDALSDMVKTDNPGMSERDAKDLVWGAGR